MGSTERVHLPGLSPLCPLLCGRLQPLTDALRSVRLAGQARMRAVSVEVEASPACPGVPGIRPGLARAGTLAHGLSPTVPGSHGVRLLTPHSAQRSSPCAPHGWAACPPGLFTGGELLPAWGPPACLVRGTRRQRPKACATRVVVQFLPRGRTAGSGVRRLQCQGKVVRDNPPSPFCLSLTPEGPLASGQCFALHRAHPRKAPFSSWCIWPSLPDVALGSYVISSHRCSRGGRLCSRAAHCKGQTQCEWALCSGPRGRQGSLGRQGCSLLRVGGLCSLRPRADARPLQYPGHARSSPHDPLDFRPPCSGFLQRRLLLQGLLWGGQAPSQPPFLTVRSGPFCS